MLFIIVFPKGGIKIKNIPITWGYDLLAILGFSLLFRKKYEVNKNHTLVLLALLPFQIVSLITILINGATNIGFTISFFTSFFVLPFIFLFILSEYFERMDFNFFIKIIRRSLLFIASYGIFLFFFRIFMGYFFEISFLTINYHDSGLLDYTKCIDRNKIFKLISTYNNGNLYGICILMLLPFYSLIEKSHLKKMVVKTSLILTISRTVWIGLIFHEFLYDFFIKKNKRLSLIKFCISSSLFIFLFLFLPKLIGFNLYWLFDKELGGRLTDFDIENYIVFFPKVSFTGISEMIYLSIFQNFGILGFTTFLLAILSPLFIYFLSYSKRKVLSLDKCLMIGIINYLFISISDGGMLYIPTLAIFWIISSLLFTAKNEEKALDKKII